VKKKTLWNVYSLEYRKKRAVARFVGSIKESKDRLERAAGDVSRRFGVELFIRDAATDRWRSPG
jgi:hypothetical protein